MSTQSVFRRCRLASMARIIQPRDRPASLGPLPMALPTLVASTHCSRSFEISLPVTRSDSPLAYASAVSMKLIPAARAESTMRPASAASVRAPNIIVPRQMGETLMPLLPSLRYSMFILPLCNDSSPQIVRVGALDRDGGPVARLECLAAGDEDHAVDFRRVRAGARERALLVDRIDQYLQPLANLALQALAADFLLRRHEARAPLFAQLRRHRVGQRIRLRPLDRRIGEAADAVEFGFLEKIEQLAEFGFGLARKTGDEGAADGDLRADRAPGADALQVHRARGRTLHQPEDARTRVLKRHV